MSIIIDILREHKTYWRQLFKLAKADIAKTYRGAALGWAWAIIKPAITIMVFWFAFSIGLRSGKPVEGYPYFLWLIAGMIPWFYMRDVITAGANSIRRYKYLVNRIKFPISTIPTFVSMSTFVVNAMLIVIMICIFIGFGYTPDIYYLQIPLYMILSFMFFTTWSLFAGVLSAMSRDFLNLVKSLVTALFWLSGILYDATKIKIDIIREILLFNPITIITHGFRNCFIYKEWFWEDPTAMRNFFIVFFVMIVLALWAYKKLRKDIPDVL